MTLSAEPQVLIVRLSAIGDCIQTLPMAAAIKDRYPGAKITWVVEKSAAPLLRDHRSIDRLIELPRGWLRSPATLWRLKRTLRESKFEIAFDPQSLTKSALIAWLAGVPRRIGLARPYGRELSLLLDNVHVEPTNEHVVDRQLELLHAIGIRWPDVRFDVPVSRAATQWVATWVDPSPLADGFLAINPGATWDSRLWPTARYAQVAARLGRQTGLPSLVVWAGAREQAWAHEIADRSGGYATIAPSTSLPELAAVLRRAKLFLGSDTGPMHLAAAVGTPCVGLFGPTRPENSGPYGAANVALQAYYQTGTSRQRRNATNEAMQAISLDMVSEACERALRNAAPRKVA